MGLKLITYVVRMTLLEESQFAALCQSLVLYFPYCQQPIKRVGNDLTIKIKLDGWDFHTDEFFERREENGVIGTWTKEEEVGL